MNLPDARNLFFQILCEDYKVHDLMCGGFDHTMWNRHPGYYLSIYLRPYPVHLSSFLSPNHGSFYLCTRSWEEVNGED